VSSPRTLPALRAAVARCDAPDFSRCPSGRGDWRFGDVDRCDVWAGFQAQAMRDLGVTEWTPDVDPATEVLYVRWRSEVPTCHGGWLDCCGVATCAALAVAREIGGTDG
jgi:hypothetical protein